MKVTKLIILILLISISLSASDKNPEINSATEVAGLYKSQIENFCDYDITEGLLKIKIDVQKGNKKVCEERKSKVPVGVVDYYRDENKEGEEVIKITAANTGSVVEILYERDVDSVKNKFLDFAEAHANLLMARITQNLQEDGKEIKLRDIANIVEQLRIIGKNGGDIGIELTKCDDFLSRYGKDNLIKKSSSQNINISKSSLNGEALFECFEELKVHFGKKSINQDKKNVLLDSVSQEGQPDELMKSLMRSLKEEVKNEVIEKLKKDIKDRILSELDKTDK
jgi:hypothetical protein